MRRDASGQLGTGQRDDCERSVPLAFAGREGRVQPDLACLDSHHRHADGMDMALYVVVFVPMDATMDMMVRDTLRGP